MTDVGIARSDVRLGSQVSSEDSETKYLIFRILVNKHNG